MRSKDVSAFFGLFFVGLCAVFHDCDLRLIFDLSLFVRLITKVMKSLFDDDHILLFISGIIKWGMCPDYF